MRLGWNDMKLTALVSVLGLSIWTLGCSGCAETSSPVKPISSATSNGDEAGSTKGGGTDVPAAEGDSGAATPEADKPADDKKDEKAQEGEQAKGDEAKKEEAPAEKKDEKKE